ncbi:glycosyltransferase [Candidatus Magnetomorum sp. HK-1]|nr:glycosyltransferase [Candidatus Magnetomorum sp. HK-1]
MKINTHKSQYLNYDEIGYFINSITGFLVKGQEKYLFDKVKSLPNNAKILEIGSCYGRSACSLATACVGTNKRVFSIDTFLGNTDGGTRKEGNTFLDVWYNNVTRLKLEA